MISKLIQKFSRMLLVASERLSSIMRTNAARAQAVCAKYVVVGPNGSVTNLGHRPDSISIGERSNIQGEILTFAHAGKIQIGKWLYLGPRSTIWSSDINGISIGDRVLISYDVHIHDTNSHPLDAQKRFMQTRAILEQGHPKSDPGIKSAPITIGDDVWIGYGASIMKGVTIGARAIIGANCVVSNDVPEDAIVKAEPRTN